MTMRPEVRCFYDLRYRVWGWLGDERMMSSEGCPPEPHIHVVGYQINKWVPRSMIEVGSWFDGRKVRFA